MAKKKSSSKADAARRGTRADPARAGEIRKEEERELAAKAKNDARFGRPSWYIDPLDTQNLSQRERVTRACFIVVGALLVLILLTRVAGILTDLEDFTLAGIQAYFLEDPDDIILSVFSVFQLIAAIMLYFCYQHYVEGDVAYTLLNLLIIFFCQLDMLNIFGIVGLVVLLWRVWKRCNAGLDIWMDEREFMGKVGDVAVSGLLFIAIFICYFVQSRVLG